MPFSIGEEVTKLSVEDKFFAVLAYNGKKFKCKAVIIASGRRARSLNVPREKELTARGVSYCATCDAPLFGGMDVAVIGSGNPAITAVNDLTKYARKIIRDIKGDKEVVLNVEGVFIEIGSIPNVEFAKDVVKLNELKEIEVDCECKTSVAGIFAAGDVTNAPEKQIIVAAGEGAKAALSAYRYLIES